MAGSSILPPGKKDTYLDPNFMANTRSAAKRARQSARNASRNASVLSTLRTRQKKLLSAVTEGDEVTIREASVALSSLLDKAAKRGIIHRNLANRKKSRLPAVRTLADEATSSVTAIT